MYRLFLAGRYTLARPVSYLAMVAIGLAVTALIVVVSIMNGFLDETRNVIRGTTADIVIFPRQGPRPYGREKLEAIVNRHPDTVGVASRLVRPAVFKIRGRTNLFIENSRDAVRAQLLVLGIDAETERTETDFAEYLAAVEVPELAVDDPHAPFRLQPGLINDRRLRYADLPSVLMSQDLLLEMQLAKGDAVELVTVPDGVELGEGPVDPTSQTFIVSGSYTTGHYKFDQATVFIPRDVFASWAGTQHEVSEMYVHAAPDASLPVVRDELDAALDDAGLPCIVETWQDRHRIWLGAVENERNILFFLFLWFLLLVCTITYSVLTTMVQEKVRDIGILSSIGASASGVGAVFVCCGLWISSIGGLFGLGLGVLLAVKVNVVKDWIEATTGFQIFRKDVYAFTEIPVTVHHGLNLAITVGTVIGAVLICLLPTLRAARMDPVEALRHE